MGYMEGQRSKAGGNKLRAGGMFLARSQYWHEHDRPRLPSNSTFVITTPTVVDTRPQMVMDRQRVAVAAPAAIAVAATAFLGTGRAAMEVGCDTCLAILGTMGRGAGGSGGGALNNH